MSELSSEEKYRLGIISKEQRKLDMMNEKYYNDRKKIDDVEYAMGGTDRSKESRQLAVDIKNQTRKVVQQEKEEREKQQEIRYRQNSNTTESIILGAKAKYDQKMNEYMKMNLWGKAKTMFAGKKPKKMTGNEIMQTYAEEVTQIELQKAIERKKKEFEEDIAWTKSYYTEHPEDLKPGSDTYNSIENIIRYKVRKYEYEIKQLEKKYQQMKENAIDLVKDFGIDHFEENSKKIK